jgi:hypothetical protein
MKDDDEGCAREGGQTCVQGTLIRLQGWQCRRTAKRTTTSRYEGAARREKGKEGKDGEREARQSQHRRERGDDER